MAKNNVQVTILGQNYTIGSDEPAEYVKQLAITVNRSIEELAGKNPRASVTMAAVLTSMTYCDEKQKSDEAARKLREQVTKYADEAAHLRISLTEAQKEISSLKSQLKTQKDKTNNKAR